MNLPLTGIPLMRKLGVVGASIAPHDKSKREFLKGKVSSEEKKEDHNQKDYRLSNSINRQVKTLF
jgi:hypothetical protein